MRPTIWQTNAPNHLEGKDGNGKKMVKRAYAEKHVIGIHTGSKVDHRCHTSRVTQPADLPGTTNGLDSDMVRAISAIKALTGEVPKFVRATFGYANDACMKVYNARGLLHIYWDVVSGDADTIKKKNVTSDYVIKRLQKQTTDLLNSRKTELIYLFHDINPITCKNINKYIGTIKSAVETAGHVPKFVASREEADALLTKKRQHGTDTPCPPKYR